MLPRTSGPRLISVVEIKLQHLLVHMQATYTSLLKTLELLLQDTLCNIFGHTCAHIHDGQQSVVFTVFMFIVVR